MGLNEVLASTMQAVAAKGTELLAKPVAFSSKGVSQGGAELLAGLRDLSLGVPVTFGRDGAGTGVILLPKNLAALMAELMIGNDPGKMPLEFNEMHMTAAAEVLSQMSGAIAEGITKASRWQVTATAGDPKDLGPEGGTAAGALVREARMVLVDGALKVGAYPPARIALVVPGSLGDKVAMTKAESAAAAPDIILGAPQAAGGMQSVQKVQFGTFAGAGAGEAGASPNLDLLLDVPLDITVELGRASKRVREVLALSPGSIVELSKLAGEPVDLLVNGRLIAKGEVVVIDENFAVRITDILSREERLSGGI